MVERGKPAWNKIVKNFGKDILLPTGEIDRIKLAEIVFSDSQKRRILNKCTHPAIQKAMLWKILKLFFQGKVWVALTSLNVIIFGWLMYTLLKFWSMIYPVHLRHFFSCYIYLILVIHVTMFLLWLVRNSTLWCFDNIRAFQAYLQLVSPAPQNNTVKRHNGYGLFKPTSLTC